MRQQAIDQMVKVRKEKNWQPHTNKANYGTGGGNVLTGAVKQDGTNHIHQTYPCHNPIHGFTNAETIWSCFGWRTATPEVAHFYLDWLCEESPWSKTGIVPSEHLTRKFMFEEGFVVTDLFNVSANLLHNFLIASRSAAEWPVYINNWFTLIKDHSVDPTFAYLMLTAFEPWLTPYTNEQVHWFTAKTKLSCVCTRDHTDWPLDLARADEQYVLNFCHGKAVGKSSWNFSPSAMTKPVNTLWGRLPDSQNKNSYVRQLYDRYSKKYGEKRPDVAASPFTSSIPPELYFSTDSIIKIIKLEQERLKL